jgi:PIN domain nuclease of toxin-antitoxin system
MVLDAETMRIFLCGEAGSERVARALEEPCQITAISLALASSQMTHVPLRELQEDLTRLCVVMTDVDSSLVGNAAKLVVNEISLEMAFAMAAAKQQGLELMIGKRFPRLVAIAAELKLKVEIVD